jgi:hypothetical protein
MDLILIELVLWAGLVFFFWALKEGLGHVESDIESLGMLNNGRQSMARVGRKQFERPERMDEPIGSYRDARIYRYAVIRGQLYQFDRVCAPDSGTTPAAEELWVEPGIVYRACQMSGQPAGQT